MGKVDIFFKLLSPNFFPQNSLKCFKNTKNFFSKIKKKKKDIYFLFLKISGQIFWDWKIKYEKTKTKTNCTCFCEKEIKKNLGRIKSSWGGNPQRNSIFILLNLYRERPLLIRMATSLLETKSFLLISKKMSKACFTLNLWGLKNFPPSNSFLQKKILFFLKKNGLLGTFFVNYKNYFTFGWKKEETFYFKKIKKNNFLSGFLVGIEKNLH